MSSKNSIKTRSRTIQASTGWSYSECLRLARDGISEEALAMLRSIRSATKGTDEPKD